MKKEYADLYAQTIETGLCTRCGACVGICPKDAIELDENAYPYLAGECIQCGFCVNSCPGSDLDLPSLSQQLYNTDYDLMDLHCHVENHYVGHPIDETIRLAGASGGVVTGLLVYMLEKGVIDGAVVVGMDKDRPYQSKGILARTKEEIIEAAQSKYCITPSLEILRQIRKEKGQFAVVALPCQIHALRKIETVDPKLFEKIYCILGLYCHCNLNLNAPVEALAAGKIDPGEIKEFRYRGGKWPGGLWVLEKDGSEKSIYRACMRTSMNVMFRLFGASRCYFCMDALAEFADLSFGDFWATDYQNDLATLERCTLISQKNARGQALLNDAVQDGAMYLHPLPQERFSKRICNMAKRKKMRAIVRITRNRSKNRPIPNYHTPIPKPTFQARRSEASYRFWSLFKHRSLRRPVLRILSTRVGEKLDQINAWRKKRFYGLHGN